MSIDILYYTSQKMKTYRQWKDQKQEEFNNFKIFRAFSQKQMEEIKQDPQYIKRKEEGQKFYSIDGGGFTSETELEKIKERMIKDQKEQDQLFKNEEFLRDAFEYELANHERQIAMDFDVLDFFNLKRTKKNLKIKNEVEKAYYKKCIENDRF